MRSNTKNSRRAYNVLRSHIIIRNGCFETVNLQKTNLEANFGGKLQNILRQAPELQLVRVQARLLNESVPDIYIDLLLLEAKFQVGKVATTPCHESVDKVSILIIPVCMKN